MNRLSVAALICLSLFVMPCAAEKKSDAPISHSFLAADLGGDKIFIVSPQGQITWQYSVVKPLEASMLKNGNILFSSKYGAKLITQDKKVIWKYKVKKRCELHSCQMLKNGNILVAVSGPCVIHEIDMDGKIQKTVKLKTNQKKTHSQMRIVKKLPNGNYLVGHNKDAVVREYDPKGKVVREFKMPAGSDAFAGYRLPNGNTLLATGDGHKIIEVDTKGKVVWQVNENDLEGNPLRFVAGLQRLKNGNTIVANWGGHGHVGQQPQIFEVTPDKKVVWQVFDNEKFKTITTVQLLDQKPKLTNEKAEAASTRACDPTP
jgi:hypothetical protein